MLPEKKHNISHPNNSQLVTFTPSNGQVVFQVVLDSEHDTVWATEQQITALFGKARRTIGEHINTIYSEGELDKESTWWEFRQVQIEGKRKVERKTAIYNLDMIISIGYRVKSPMGIEFRKWATKQLKDYLIKGYAINTELLETQKGKIVALEKQVDSLNEKTFETQKVLTDGFLSIITHYSKSFELLNKYDTEDLSIDNLNDNIIYVINYTDVIPFRHI